MKCDKCKKDFSYWTELVLATFDIRGFKNEKYKLKRLVCPTCFEFYAKLENK
jgi:hypothetical protein